VIPGSITELVNGLAKRSELSEATSESATSLQGMIDRNQVNPTGSLFIDVEDSDTDIDSLRSALGSRFRTSVDPSQ
jgi:hypothetical protein